MVVKSVLLFLLLLGPVSQAGFAEQELITENEIEKALFADQKRSQQILGDDIVIVRKKAGSSVTMSQEFGFQTHQNIDSFLGEFDNPVRPLPIDSGNDDDGKGALSDYNVGMGYAPGS